MIPRSLLAAALAGASLTAQSFTYTDFSNVAPLALLGNAVQSGTALQLTANSSNQTGWAWHRTAMPVIAGFDTTFTFRITPPTIGTKAEGMALVIHDDPNGLATQGGLIWGMGYGTGSNSAVGIRNSIAIELDTFQDGFLSDTSANEITIHTRGQLGNHENEQYSIARATPAQNLSNGAVHSLRVRYVPGTIEVYVDGAATPSITRAYSLTSGGLYANNLAAPAPNLANGTAWAGFCATTGNGTLTELVEVLSWTWTSTPLADPCYAGNVGEDTLRVAGSTGGALRTVQLPTYVPFDIAMASPTSFGPGAPWVLLLSVAPSPGAPGTNVGFGTLCMPPFALGSLVLLDSTGTYGPLVGPAPATIPVPPGIITQSLDITAQGVVGIQSSPLTLAVTNAIDVEFRPSAAPTISTVSPPSTAVGQPITITGARFLAGCELRVNGTPVAPTSRTDTQIVFPYPAGLPCGSQLQVRNLDGQSATGPINPTATVTGTILGSGPAAGGVPFVIQGSGFAQGMTVTIGGVLATIPQPVLSTTTIVVTTPPGTPGVAPVVVTTPGGCTATTTYTYL